MANGRTVAPARKALAGVLGTLAAFVIFFGAGRGSWSTTAIGGALLILAIGLVAVGAFGGGSRTWVAGSAHVVSASEPPPNSAYGRCEMQIVIDAAGMPAAAVKIRDSRVPVSKWPDAGSYLPIMVAVDDPRRVRIQWDEMLTHAEAAEEERANSYRAATAGLLRPEEQYAAYAGASNGLLPEDDLFDYEPDPGQSYGDRSSGDPTEPSATEPSATVDLADEVAGVHADAEPGTPRSGPTANPPAAGATPVRTVTADEDPDLDIDLGDTPTSHRNGETDRDGSDDRGERPRVPGRRLPPDDSEREPVIITETPDGPVVEGQFIERSAAGSAPGNPGNAGGGTVGGPSFGSTPLPRRKPRPRPPRDPEATAAKTGSTAAGATAAGATAAAAEAATAMRSGSGPVGEQGGQPADGPPQTGGTGPAGTSKTGPAGTSGTGPAQTGEPSSTERPVTPGTPAGEPDGDVPGDAASGPVTDGSAAQRPTGEGQSGDGTILGAYPGVRPGTASAAHGAGITVLVTDLERSIGFYREMLGFFEIDGGDGHAVLASGDTRLVLREVTPVNRRVAHLNLEVADVEATYHDLKNKGVGFTYTPRPVNRTDQLELWAAAFRDPDGHSIAITQWRPRPQE